MSKLVDNCRNATFNTLLGVMNIKNVILDTSRKDSKNVYQHTSIWRFKPMDKSGPQSLGRTKCVNAKPINVDKRSREHENGNNL